MVGSHSTEPMVNKRRLPDTGPGNDGNDIDILVCPCTIQKSDIFLSTKNIASRNRQSGYGNLLRTESLWRLASSDAQSARGRLLEPLTSDSTPRVDSTHYRRCRLQKFSRVLKSPPRVFLEEHFK